MMFLYRPEVEAAATKHHLDADLVQAVCMVESSGSTIAYRFEPAFWERYLRTNPLYSKANPRRVSASYGLLQVMFPTAIDHGMPIETPPEMLYMPEYGLEWGCKILRGCVVWANGDISAALAAYNGGKTADNRPGRVPKRNQAYVEKVMKALATIQFA